MFNLLPDYIRNINSDKIEHFKVALDMFLSCVPDQPTIPERTRPAATNCLLDQIPMMGV